MLNLNLNDVLVEFKDGSIHNVGPTDKQATAKLFDVTTVEARAFGDRRVKIVGQDDAGNEVQLAVSPEQIRAIIEDVETLEADSSLFE